jgi:hypothetical protein
MNAEHPEPRAGSDHPSLKHHLPRLLEEVGGGASLPSSRRLGRVAAPGVMNSSRSPKRQRRQKR